MLMDTMKTNNDNSRVHPMMWIHGAIDDSVMTPMQMRFLLKLVRMKNKKGEVRETNEVLIKAMKIHKATLTKLIRAFEEWGVIERILVDNNHRTIRIMPAERWRVPQKAHSTFGDVTKIGFDVTPLWVADFIEDSGLSANEMRILLHVARRSENGWCWESKENMWKKCGVARSVTLRTLKLLEAWGVLECKRRYYHTNRYRVTPSTQWKLPGKARVRPSKTPPKAPKKEGGILSDAKGGDLASYKGVLKRSYKQILPTEEAATPTAPLREGAFEEEDSCRQERAMAMSVLPSPTIQSSPLDAQPGNSEPAIPVISGSNDPYKETLSLVAERVSRAKKPKKESLTAKLIRRFNELHWEHIGAPAKVNWQKDGMNAKRLIKMYEGKKTPERAVDAILAVVSDAFKLAKVDTAEGYWSGRISSVSLLYCHWDKIMGEVRNPAAVGMRRMKQLRKIIDTSVCNPEMLCYNESKMTHENLKEYEDAIAELDKLIMGGDAKMLNKGWVDREWSTKDYFAELQERADIVGTELA